MLGATNGSSTSVWMDTVSVPAFPPLAGDLEAGVCVIGAGITGLTSAWLLAQEARVQGVRGAQANVMARYGEWLTGGDVDLVHAIAPGEGAVLRDGLRRIAVYRDPHGALHVLSAKCTHLGCAVHWNGAERSWDCPCHASRFDTEGNVLHGPAPTALAKVELPADAAPPPRERRSGARRGVR